MILSDDEKELILAKRKQEESNSPIKVGFLKHDLTQNVLLGDIFSIDDLGGLECADYITTGTFEKAISKLKNEFYFSRWRLPRETLFACYKERGAEIWYDDAGFGLEEYSEWADEHLINIQKYDPTKHELVRLK